MQLVSDAGLSVDVAAAVAVVDCVVVVVGPGGDGAGLSVFCFLASGGLGPGADLEEVFASFLGDEVEDVTGDLVGVGDMRGTFLISIIFLTSNTLSEVLVEVSVSLVFFIINFVNLVAQGSIIFIKIY